MKLGVYVLAAGAIATGIVNLAFSAFDPAEEPIQAWGNSVPSHGVFPDFIAVILILGAALMVPRRTAAFGAIALGVCYLLFAIFAAPRIVIAPYYVGWRGAIGGAVGVGQNLIVAAAATFVAASGLPSTARLQKVTEIARWVFGVSTIFFGLGHLTSPGSIAAMIPTWLPPDETFWAIFTGIAFVLAGIAILWGMLGALAARLLALMLAVFSVLVLVRQLFVFPHQHAAWGVNVYNVAAVGSALILAAWLDARRPGLRLETHHAPSVG